MTPDEFEYLSGVLHERSGLVVTKEKIYLLETRLTPLTKKHGIDGLGNLVGKLRNGGGEPLLNEVVDAMTTNETFFFRDKSPFDQFKETVLPNLLELRGVQKSIRIWCAACSTGQEPYSISMLLKEDAAKLAGWRTDIVATDLSKEAMDKAKVGLYSQFEVQRGLPVQFMVKYFKQMNETWQIDSAIRAMVNFRPLNLLEDFRGLGRFDVVYCRNVLIYFDRETKAAVLDRVHQVMSPDGYLFLGGSETVLGITDSFRPIKGMRGLYEPT
jgi:chemotaxis protein methyltransferase CheR